jgi:hypothetical protein
MERQKGSGKQASDDGSKSLNNNLRVQPVLSLSFGCWDEPEKTYLADVRSAT